MDGGGPAGKQQLGRDSRGESFFEIRCQVAASRDTAVCEDPLLGTSTQTSISESSQCPRAIHLLVNPPHVWLSHPMAF